MGHSIEIGAVPNNVDVKTAVYQGSQTIGSSHDSAQDGEKRAGLPQLPLLQRKLKSRHLQMIAIGTSPTVGSPLCPMLI